MNRSIGVGGDIENNSCELQGADIGAAGVIFILAYKHTVGSIRLLAVMSGVTGL